MKRSPKQLRMTLSILFLIGTPVCYFGAALVTYFQPRRYTSVAEFQLLRPTSDASRIKVAFENAKEKLPETFSEMMKNVAWTGKVRLEDADAPGRYLIIAAEAGNALDAANIANAIQFLVGDYLRGPPDPNQTAPVHAIRVLRRANPNFYPSSPNVPKNMMLGLVMATTCGIAGIVFLFSALAIVEPPQMITGESPPKSNDRFDY